MQKSQFEGGMLEFIGINIVVWLVTVLTLGIAYPWMYCWYRRWQLNHTVIESQRLKYAATGTKMMGFVMKWILIYIAIVIITILIIKNNPYLIVFYYILIIPLSYIMQYDFLKWETKYIEFE